MVWDIICIRLPPLTITLQNKLLRRSPEAIGLSKELSDPPWTSRSPGVRIRSSSGARDYDLLDAPALYYLSSASPPPPTTNSVNMPRISPPVSLFRAQICPVSRFLCAAAPAVNGTTISPPLMVSIFDYFLFSRRTVTFYGFFLQILI